MATIRMRIAELLETGEFTALDISKAIGIKEKEVYQHLVHIEKSAKGKGKKMVITPCRCLACGFTFKDRKRLTRPSRCPKCKEERISEAFFRIQ